MPSDAAWSTNHSGATNQPVGDFSNQTVLTVHLPLKTWVSPGHENMTVSLQLVSLPVVE